MTDPKECPVTRDFRDPLWDFEKRVEMEAALKIGWEQEKWQFARSIDPLVTARDCLYCGNPEGVRLHFSNTAYTYSQADLEAEKPDSNGPHPLCADCTERDNEHWHSMWAEYYSGCL